MKHSLKCGIPWTRILFVFNQNAIEQLSCQVTANSQPQERSAFDNAAESAIPSTSLFLQSGQSRTASSCRPGIHQSGCADFITG